MTTDLRVLHEDEVEVCGKELVAEASQLGLAPGDWPRSIGIINDDRVGKLYRWRRVDERCAVYETVPGERLVVLND